MRLFEGLLNACLFQFNTIINTPTLGQVALMGAGKVGTVNIKTGNDASSWMFVQ